MAVDTPLLRINLELPDAAQSVPLCRRMLRFFLDELSVPEARAADIELAISEATGNVVLHAYVEDGHYYRVTIEFFPHCVRLQVEDSGCGFVREDVPAPSSDQPGGRGLWLIEQLADSAAVTTLPNGGCHLAAEFALPHPLAFPAPPPIWIAEPPGDDDPAEDAR
jgi:anti-sigma regulatory factor (Ser/Thr protein kinase)